MRTAPIAASLASGSAFTAVYFIPNVELQLFARGAAEMAGLFSGAPVLHIPEGWLLPFHHQAVLVNEACSGVTFFVMLTALLSWHIARIRNSVASAIMLALPLSLALALTINALRVLCLAQMHRWVIPLLPETYAHTAHLMVGVAVFLPALIVFNLAFEYYGNPQRASACESTN